MSIFCYKYHDLHQGSDDNHTFHIINIIKIICFKISLARILLLLKLLLYELFRYTLYTYLDQNLYLLLYDTVTSTVFQVSTKIINMSILSNVKIRVMTFLKQVIANKGARLVDL